MLKNTSFAFILLFIGADAAIIPINLKAHLQKYNPLKIHMLPKFLEFDIWLESIQQSTKRAGPLYSVFQRQNILHLAALNLARDPRPRTALLGPRAFSARAVNSLGWSFVW
jgi:hypothetical protein